MIRIATYTSVRAAVISAAIRHLAALPGSFRPVHAKGSAGAEAIAFSGFGLVVCQSPGSLNFDSSSSIEFMAEVLGRRAGRAPCLASLNWDARSWPRANPPQLR
jgi:hypothetical protein